MSPLKNSFKRSIPLTLNAYFQHFKIENKQAPALVRTRRLLVPPAPTSTLLNRAFHKKRDLSLQFSSRSARNLL